MKKNNKNQNQEVVLNDDLNPEFIFSTVATDLLVQAVNGKIDLKELAKKTLKNRGLDNQGKWVGFKN